MRIFSLLFILIFSFSAQARVFDFSGESLAAYFHTTGGLSKIGDLAYSNSSGASTVFTDTVPYHPGFELGFLFGIGGAMVVKAGAELIQTKQLTAISGKNASGTELFTLSSRVFAFNPNLTFEFNISQDKTSRFFFALSAGWSIIDMDNDYTFSATGKSELSVAADYIEKSQATMITYGSYIGYEILAVDNVTFLMNVGYRHIPVSQFEYKNDYADLIGSLQKTKGEAVVNNDGSIRSMDFGGPFVGLGFRFYINFM
ncbi:MAG: hypothetical protein HOO06_08975 [Bdellovibrionaceae bacterium]|nr:hypothetical protein [Pseudobdellovibrionaceae bacterium]